MIARVQRMTGKYGALEYIFFSSFVRFASMNPNGIARVSARYSIIGFLIGVCY